MNNSSKCDNCNDTILYSLFNKLPTYHDTLFTYKNNIMCNKCCNTVLYLNPNIYDINNINNINKIININSFTYIDICYKCTPWYTETTKCYYCKNNINLINEDMKCDLCNNKATVYNNRIIDYFSRTKKLDALCRSCIRYSPDTINNLHVCAECALLDLPSLLNVKDIKCKCIIKKNYICSLLYCEKHYDKFKKIMNEILLIEDIKNIIISYIIISYKL